MPRERKSGTYRIALDEQWTLSDLYSFPHVFDQVYSFLFSLEALTPEWAEDRIARTYHAYPWRGGYSAVNFYQNLAAAIPRDLRATIKSIRYSSPGWIELSLMISLALYIKKLVNHLVDAGSRINALYSDIQKGISERKLQRIEVRRKELELSKENVEFIEEPCRSMAGLMGFEDLGQLHKRTENPLASLKILLSLYRRLRILARYQEDHMIDLKGDDDQ